MHSDNVFGAEPPRDANGEIIPLDTETLYETDGQVFHVLAFRYSPKGREWFASGGYTGNKNGWCADTNRLLLAPPDSWEKLEEDAKMVKACDYAHAPRDEYGITVCRDCRFQKSKSCRQEMILDIIARAKKLAGIEEQDGGERTAIADKEER